MKWRWPRTETLRAGARLALGFLAGLLVWLALSPAYERMLAAGAERALRWTEWPATTRLEASRGEVLVERQDFPPASPRPGLPAADLHFNFVLLVALFALRGRPFRDDWIARFLLAAVLLWLVHTTALVFHVRSVYATRLGPWSAEHYGVVARNLWAGGLHFYQIAGRFAAPFAIWWLLARPDDPAQEETNHRARPSRRARSAALRVVK